MMLPTMDSWSLIGPDQIVVVLPVDSVKWKKGKECVRYRGFFLPRENEIQYEKVEIPNSGFTISMFPDYSIKYFHYYPKYYCEINLVKLEHPDLKKYPFTIATYIESRNLVTMISRSWNIVEGVLSGNFCCIHESGISGLTHTIFDVEDPDNMIMSNGKNIGKIISDGKGTTKWKVGYRYITKTEKSFIYLGDITDGWYKNIYGSGFGDSLPSTFSHVYGKQEGPVSLIYDVTSLGKDETDLLNINKGGYVSVFLLSYLYYIMVNKLGAYKSYLKTINRKTHPAIELNKQFEDDEKNLKEIITGFYTSRYPTYKDFLPLVDRNELTEENRRLFDKEFIRIIEGYVSNRRSSYYSSQKLDISVARNPEKFLEYLKNNKPTYRYYGSEIYGVLDYLGEDEFKKIIPRCSF